MSGIRQYGSDEVELQNLEDADERYIEEITKAPRVVRPQSELDIMRATATRPCWSCTHFDKEAGREAMIKDRFWESLAIEHKWRVEEWLKSPDRYGLCQMYGSSSEGYRLVDGMAPGFARKSDFDSTLVGKPGGDQKVQCPYWQDKQAGRIKKVTGR